MDKLTIKDIELNLSSLSGWVFDNNKISITYTLNSFMEVMSFVNLISDKSEQINHHPKIIIDFKTVEFNLVTHSIGGVSKLDFQLANFIHETYDELFTPDF